MLSSSRDPCPQTSRRWSGAWFSLYMGDQTESVTITVTPFDGDCDLYVRVGRGTAHTWSYDYRSTSAGSSADTVIIPEEKMCVDCTISILVVGFTSSRFSVLATVEDSTVALADTVPLRGALAKGSCQFYTLSLSRNATTTYVLTLLSGDANIYVSTRERQPCSAGANVVSSEFSMSGVFPFVDLSSKASHFFVGVGGKNRNATYTLRASADVGDSAPALFPLLAGLPQNDIILDSKGWKYYRMQLQAGHERINVRASNEVGDLDIYLQRCSRGSATLCFQQNQGWPNETNYLSTTLGKQRDFLAMDRQDDIPTLYIIGIKSWSDVVAYQVSYVTWHSTLALSPGVTVTDHVFMRETDFFSIEVEAASAGYQTLQIILTTLSGDADIYVSTKTKHPSPRNYTWSAVDYGDDVLEISPAEPSRYFIGIYGASESTYTLTVAVDTTLVSLEDGQPLSGSLGMLQWNYYQFYYPSWSSDDVSITLSTLSGNADVYVTLDGSIPTWFHYDFASSHFMTVTDSIFIGADEPALTACKLTARCKIIIGVDAVLSSRFTITIATSSVIRSLLHGQPLYSSVGVGRSDYFATPIFTNFSSSLTFKVSMTVSTGRVVVYLSCDSSRPGATDYYWSFAVSSSQADGSFALPAYELEDRGCLDSSAESMYLTVSADGVTSGYSILVTVAVDDSSTPTTLMPGSAQAGTLEYHGFEWFAFYPRKTYEDVQLTLGVAHGTATLYVCKSLTERVFFDASSGSVQGPYITYGAAATLDHDTVLNNCRSRENCYLLVAVFSTYAQSSTSFTLSLSFRDSIKQLISGVPQSGQVQQSRYQYYFFSLVVSSASSTVLPDVVISLTTSHGDSDLYTALAPVNHPTRQNYSWISTFYGMDIISIQADQYARVCRWKTPTRDTRQCDFFIGVFGFTNSSYSLVSVTDSGFASRTRLESGRQQQGRVPQGRYNYYEFTSTAPDSQGLPIDLRVSLSSLDGNDADIYLSFSSEPGRDNYDYKSTNFAGSVDEIVVSPSMAHYCVDCTVYIAVYGFQTAEYSILATSGQLEELHSGQQSGGHVDSSTYRYYSFFNTDPAGTITISLAVASGDGDLYINTFKRSSISDVVTYPTTTRYTWRSLRTGSDLIKIPYTDAHFCSDCFFVIGVYGFRNCSYLISAAEKEDQLLKLVLTRSQRVVVSGTPTSRFFSLTPPNTVDDVTVTVTPLTSGFADIFVKVFNRSTNMKSSDVTNSSFPNPADPDSYSFSTAGSQLDALVIPVHELRLVYGLFVIAVVPRGGVQTMSYSIIATSSSSALPLQAGVPQNQFVDGGRNVFFVYYPHAFSGQPSKFRRDL